MAYDELELDRIGDRKTAVFFIISDTTQTYNFLVALAFSQMFNLLCERADNVHGGRLPHHVRVLWDEAANTGQVPQLEKIVAVIRSREISLTLFYQQLAQCKAIYDKHAETILGNMDSVIFLGGREASTIKEISENWLGKATISMQTDNPQGKEIENFDKVFEMKLRYFENTAIFIQKLKITGATYMIEGYMEFGACNDENCLPPTEVSFSFSGKGVAAATTSKTTEPAKTETAITEVPVAETATATTATDSATTAALIGNDTAVQDYWTPVIQELNTFGETTSQQDRSWIYIFFAGFIGGLLALFTPCVWPIIPMTVSFFLKRSKDKKKGIRDAWTYGASIVVIYVLLGLAITLIFGASALNALSTNAIFNIFFCLMLIVFAASFFGAFELTLPSKWSNAVDSKAEQTSGLLSIFLMAFTLSLVSFSCTGPIIGFLLVEVSTTGSVVAPAIGMLGFALALALPFTLFAMFPSWLKSMPKSGGWMNVIKVVLGFLELAFALKFLSVADLAYGWGILDRETFLALWIVIFALLGFYLLGKIKFPHDDDDDKVGVARFFMALISLAFAVYMVPGLWGAPLKAVSAFAPPMNTQDFNLYTNEVHAQFDDYDAGMEYAKRTGKPVMLDFTGYGCVNCRKMEAAVWTDPKVNKLMTEDYVLITLFVDNKTPLPEHIKVMENGKERTLRTIGDKWSYLQRSKFGANAQPFYVLIDNEGKPLNKSYSYDEDIDKYVDFLQTGLQNYKK